MREAAPIRTFDSKLDRILGGGLPAHSFNIVAGEPGAGKSIFIQHWLFHHIEADPTARVLYLTTLSEPPAKMIRYMRTFAFFRPDLFQDRFELDDVGPVIREEPFEEILKYIVGRVEKTNPSILVIDSFKAIRDLAPGVEAFRRFVYQIAVRLYGHRCTTLLVGEYAPEQLLESAEFSVADGILHFGMSKRSGELQRFFRVHKLRGRDPIRLPIAFSISDGGIEIEYIATEQEGVRPTLEIKRRPTGIPGLDNLLRGGIPPGRAVLISGVSGTGKTSLSLQVTARALEANERVLYYSFEEPVADLVATARGFGWDLQKSIESEHLRLVHIPQTDIRIEREIRRMEKDIKEVRPSWVVVDSFSVYLYRVKDPAIFREKLYQLKYLLHNSGATGLLLSDIPANAVNQLSRMGVEETVADGAIVLSSEISGGSRKRFLEVYKMRQTNHVQGSHRMLIGSGGIEVYYRGDSPPVVPTKERRISFSPVEALLQGKPRYDSSWLIRGEPGLGKSTLAMQFAVEGVKNGESVLFVSADAPDQDVRRRLLDLGIDVASMGPERLRLLDAYSGREPRLDPADFWLLMFTVEEIAAQMEHPLRIIFDSITPIQVLNGGEEFVNLIFRKNRFLRGPEVAVFDTFLYQHDSDATSLPLLHSYDVVLDLFAVGEKRGSQSRNMQVAKARDVSADASAVSYQIEPAIGICRVDAER